MNGHGWTRLHVQDYTSPRDSWLYPTASFRGTRFTDRHRCACHTQLCTRPATEEDLLCDECREHPDCRATLTT